ncbi:hypothetical protein MOUN0_J03840 [Monosporozyma unispora]|nr:hypothetical protein C6P44_001412 [Kazachstania unispora]
MADIFPDFVFKKSKKRVKKTYVKKHIILDDDSNNDEKDIITLSQNSDIESKVSQFISNLNHKNIINNALLSKEITNNVGITKKSFKDVNISTHCYDNKRTMLLSKDEDREDVSNLDDNLDEKLPNFKAEELLDDDTTLVTVVSKSKMPRAKTTKNKSFSRMINSNSNLKNQQDYAFIINNKLPLYSQLLNVITTINDDKDFRDYLIKWNLKEFLNHCLNHKNIDTSECRYLMMLVLIQLNIPMDEDLGLVTGPLIQLISKTIIPSLRDSFQLSCITNVNKFTKSTILSFVKSNNLNNVTNHHLCLKLWSLHYNHLPDLLPHVNQIMEEESYDNINTEYKVKKHSLLSNIILKFGQSLLDNIDLNKLLITWFMKNYDFVLTDKPFVMAFITLTNDKSLLSELNCDVINKIISLLVNSKISCISTEDRESLQLEICQMGLCLHLGDYINDNIQIKDWGKTINQLSKRIIPQVKTTFSSDDDGEFELGMFILLLFLISYRSNEKKYQFNNPQDKDLLLNQLKSFKSIVNNNPTITNNINLIIEKFT